MPAAIAPPAAVMLLVVLAGCATGPQDTADPLAPVPADFSVDLAVLGGPGVDRALTAHARPGRFILFADGSLHWGSQSQRGADWLPPRRRSLTSRQVAELWSLAQHLGLTDPANADPLVNGKLIEPQPGQTVCLAVFTGHRGRWGYVRRRDADQPPDQAMTRLARRLAELAWAGDLLPEPVRAAPRRYDFGPDPYARYRRP